MLAEVDGASMNIWLTVRTGIAFFLVAFGIALIFVHSQDERLMLGSVIFAVGATFLLRVALAVSRR
jgi:hypothetical protein